MASGLNNTLGFLAKIGVRLATAIVGVQLAAVALLGVDANAQTAAIERVCPLPQPGHASCGVLRVKSSPAPAQAVTPAGTRAEAAAFATPSGYGPADIQSAYNLDVTQGSGHVVAVTVAYDDPSAEADLAAYRAQYGLPPCTTANGCFRKINQNGAAAPLPGPEPASDNAVWADSASMYLDEVSATCPLCGLVLVEANDDHSEGLLAANNAAAAQPGVVAIALSYQQVSGETSADPAFCSAFFSYPGIAITASSGNDGYSPADLAPPQSCATVTSVGSTTLSRAANARGWTETVWSASASEGTASGCSTVIPKPAFQTDTGCANRTMVDVAAVGDPATGLAVYAVGLWVVLGGEPGGLIAGIYGLAPAPKAGDFPVAYPYANPGALNDITVGSTAACSPVYLCTAGVGYDGPSGLGTPNGSAAFGPRGDDFSISVAPNSVSLAQGASGSATVATTTNLGSAQAVVLSVAGVPAGASGTFSPAAILSGSSSVLSLSAGTAAAGTYLLTVTASGSATTHSTTLTLVVTQPAPNFSITASPTKLLVKRGAVGAVQIAVVGVNGFAGKVSLKVSGLPSGVMKALVPATVTGSGSAHLVVLVEPKQPPGTFALTITGTSGSLLHSSTVVLTVQ